MNLQDFACRVSDLIWGGELGWDRKDGLEDLFKQVEKYVKQQRQQNSKLNDGVSALANKRRGREANEAPTCKTTESRKQKAESKNENDGRKEEGQ